MISQKARCTCRDGILDVLVHVRPVVAKTYLMQRVIEAEMASKRVDVKGSEDVLLKVRGYNYKSYLFGGSSDWLEETKTFVIHSYVRVT